MTKLGKVRQIDLRTVWPDEAKNFTPWLAEEDNIDLLSEKIGIELDVIATEKNIGSFRADIICKVSGTEHYVLIENQLEKTDHSHLGQLITYAAGMVADGQDEVTIIWISSKLTDEHKRALDWLNLITPEKVSFFGIEVAVWCIDNGNPAPVFNIMSSPNQWSKQIRQSTISSLSNDTQRLYSQYFQELKDFMGKNESTVQLENTRQKGNSIGTRNFGLSNVRLFVSISTKDNFIAIVLIINGEQSKTIYDKLREEVYEDSLREVSENLSWNKMEEKVSSKIELKEIFDITDIDNREAQFSWIMNNLEKMTEYFKKRVKNTIKELNIA